MKPSVGRIVHYVSYGTPGGEYTSQCRAAVVASVYGPDDNHLDLVVLNPTGLLFCCCSQDETAKTGGTWHWPERVE